MPRKIPGARRFTIADAMILVVGAAVGTLFVKAFLPGLSRQLQFSRRLNGGTLGLMQLAQSWLHGPGSCVVVPLMIATLFLRLRQPRPQWHRLARQPGFAVCAGVVASLIPGALWYISIRHRVGFTQRSGVFDQIWYKLIYCSNSAAIGAWVALLMSRRWRASSDWVDRLGRLLGAYWIFVFALRLVQTCLVKLLTWFS